jgi:hypothetical protein
MIYLTCIAQSVKFFVFFPYSEIGIPQSVFPACAKPRLPKPCAAGRRFGVGGRNPKSYLVGGTDIAFIFSIWALIR